MNKRQADFNLERIALNDQQIKVADKPNRKGEKNEEVVMCFIITMFLWLF